MQHKFSVHQYKGEGGGGGEVMSQVYFIQHFMHHKPVRQNFKSLLVCEVSGKS